MLRYGFKARLYGWAFTRMVSDYCGERHPELDFDSHRKEMRERYRAMLTRTPDIGGNSNEANLIMACFILSVPDIYPGMSPDLLDEIMQGCMNSRFIRRLFSGERRSGRMFSDRVQDRKVRESEASHSSEYDFDWEYDYVKGDGEFWCRYTRCGICRLAEKEGKTEYLKVLCNTDYPRFEASGAMLERTGTLASGDGCCDFHVVRVDQKD